MKTLNNISKKLSGTKLVYKIIGILVLVVGSVALVGTLFMLLWNALMPSIFGLGEITILQGFGLIVLSKVLLGGVEAKSNTPNNTIEINPTSKTDDKEENQITDKIISKESIDEDELYEQWWSKEGEAYFEEYLTNATTDNA